MCKFAMQTQTTVFRRGTKLKFIYWKIPMWLLGIKVTQSTIATCHLAHPSPPSVAEAQNLNPYRLLNFLVIYLAHPAGHFF
ncbi:hypothetical protein GQ53DRAFT_94581 [Thozetella sp. PMI_491]|nr:hypothetical protein GQ53DRAFT_94581 [Thozetella sp. PMI_491]